MTALVSLPGLDLMTGGPLVLVDRGGGAPSSSIVLRGGPGTGKSIVATWIATTTAAQLGGDIVYACVELLPAELAEQVSRTYSEKTRVPVLAPPWPRVDAAGTRIFAASLALGARESAEETREKFVDALPNLFEVARDVAGRQPRVVVIDAVSAGYGLGGSDAARAIADAAVKWAGEVGVILVVIEETTDERGSPWSFAVDVVLQMERGGRASGVREIRVIKNRFGRAVTAPGQLEFGSRPEIWPPLAAYAGRALRRARPKDLEVADPQWDPAIEVKLGELGEDDGATVANCVCALLGPRPLRPRDLLGATTHDSTVLQFTARGSQALWGIQLGRLASFTFGGQLATPEGVLASVVFALESAKRPVRLMSFDWLDPTAELLARADATQWALVSLARAWELSLIIIGPPLRSVWSEFDAVLIHEGGTTNVYAPGDTESINSALKKRSTWTLQVPKPR